MLLKAGGNLICDSLIRRIEREEGIEVRLHSLLIPMNCEERCQLEVAELHQFFQDWFQGKLGETDEAFARFASVMAEGFEIISPAGRAMKRDVILDAVRAGHGKEPDAKIWIENHRHLFTHGDLSLVTYEEWQTMGEKKRGRLSTALLRITQNTPNNLQWLHVHETWLPED